MTDEDFKKRVRRFVEEAFRPNEGWDIQERKVENEVDVIVMRRSGATAIARLVSQGSISKEQVRELSALRDMNQAYLGIIYRPPEVEVEPEAARLSTRLGVRVIEVG